MKILAIRGANLASLEGEFAIELAEGPLARAGVFAICGPTGAGKSTLLDAMCVALFDTAPRLTGGSRVRVGREEQDEGERLTTSDPRSILRKGTGQGFAEVDFLGVDERRYRARWEVRRARGRANAKLQASTMSLRDLGDDRIVAAERKGEVKEAIEGRLGLTFDQFRRSVLLAQGDFAAFLDADAKERAGLLERMTGTEIYGRISIQAFTRAGEERRALEMLVGRVELVAVLTETQRAEQEEQRTALEIRAREDELLTHGAREAVQWHAQLAGLQKEETAARGEHDHVVRQLALAESKRQELEAYQRALPVKPRLDEADRATALARAKQAELARLEEERRAADESATEAERAAAEASHAVEAAEQALGDAGPALAQARLLAAELGSSVARVREHEARAVRHEAECADVRARRASLEEALATQEREARAAKDWLDAHPAPERLAARWDRHEARLDRLRELSSELSFLRAAQGSAESARAEGIARHSACSSAAALAAASRAAAEEAWRAKEAQARAAPSEALGPVRSRWVARRATLESVGGLVDRAVGADGEERRQRLAAARAEGEAERARRDAAAADEERAQVRARLEEAGHARDALRSTLDLAGRRADLREGEPCPLCGSPDHPFARELPPVESLLGAQDHRVRELTGALSVLDARAAGARKTAEAKDEAGRAALEDAGRWAAELAAAREGLAEAARALALSEPAVGPAVGPAQWGSLFLSAGGAADGPLFDPRARGAIEEARELADATLVTLGAEEQARREVEGEARSLRERFESARGAAEEAAREAETATQARSVAIRELDRLEREVGERAARVDAIAGELGDALSLFPSWRERLAADAGVLVAEVRREVLAWRERASVLDRATQATRELEPALGAARERDDGARERLAEVRAELARAAAELASKSAERASVLGGADPDAHERALREALDRARQRARERQIALTSATRLSVERSARASGLREALAEALVEAERAAERLAHVLAIAGISEEEARARLGRDRVELEGWRRELEALDAERARQAAVLSERTRKRVAHAEQDRPLLEADAAADAMATAQRRSGETRELLMAARHRLERDDENRAQAAALAAELETHRERLSVWEALSELVGSASGAKLRVFAQTLTLELLLEHANHHLADLAPRYSLARVPGDDLSLMVIDHQMGEEVRSIGSLSGGESFLVALGMALGLASLSSQRARVDSLFIDEGFGALDPASLDVVLSTLDALQSTGRQIGLISHVSTMAERFDTRISLVAAGPARSRVELVEGLG